MERTFKRSFGSLESVLAFIREFASENEISQIDDNAASFIIEEIFTNMVKYNPGGKTDIVIRLAKDGGKLTITMVDHTNVPFDLTKPKPVDIDQSLHDRRPGGLGIYLINKIADKVDYRFDSGVSTITVIKNLETQ
jgi:serine/threonine-protein kinase RsbW